jgi:hypothetical protein
LISCSFGASV